MAIDDQARLTRAEARRFGVTVGAALVLLAAVSLWRHHRVAPAILVAVGVLLLGLAVLAPASLRPLRTLWMGTGRAIGRVTTPIVLALLYFGVLTPIGLLTRLVGRRPLTRFREPGSIWTPRTGAARRGDLKRQF